MMSRIRMYWRWLILGSLLVGVLFPAPAVAQPIIPPVWDIVADNFEGGSLDAWETSGTYTPYLSPGNGRSGSTGLAVPMGQGNGYIYQSGVSRSEEGYLIFDLNPNNAVTRETLAYVLTSIGIDMVNERQFSDGVDTLRRAHRLDPNEPYVFKSLSKGLSVHGVDRYNKGDTWQGRTLIEEALRIDPENEHAITNYRTM